MDNDNIDINVSEIINNTPFNSYEDLFNAIYNKKATLKLLRSDCSQIASIKHPYSTLLMYLGFLITTIIIILCSIKFHNYWLFLFIPINFFLQSFIIYVPKLSSLSFIALLIDLFLFKLPNFITIEFLCVFLISIFYHLWWNKIYKYAISELRFNKEAFFWSWQRYGLSIEDSFGNTYDKFKLENKNGIS